MAVLPWFKFKSKNTEQIQNDAEAIENRMFRSLRFRFIIIAGLAILVVLTSVIGVLNSARYWQTKQEVQQVLNVLSDNDGSFPSLSEAAKSLGGEISEDTLSQYRYLSARVDKSGKIVSLDRTNISELNQTEAENYIQISLDSSQKTGNVVANRRHYAYQVTKTDSGTLVVLLDATSFYENFQELISLSLYMGFAGLVFFLAMVSVFSKRVIEPFVRNYQQQRRFIVNAGHELKTPLAIISANNDLMELTTGETEWTKSTADQISRLTGLINGLVALARLEEQPDLVLEDLDFSLIAEDAAEDFKGPVIRDGKHFIMEIEPNIHVKAEQKSLFELVTILCDNANKYCDPEGTVAIRLSTAGRRNKRAKLDISNTYAEGKTVDYSKFFERFYREDESHNSARKGYGIGLSMAKSMVQLFKGKLSVHYKDDTITFTLIL